MDAEQNYNSVKDVLTPVILKLLHKAEMKEYFLIWGYY